MLRGGVWGLNGIRPEKLQECKTAWPDITILNSLCCLFLFVFCLPGQLERAYCLSTRALQKYKLLLNSFCNLLRHSTTKSLYFVKLYKDMFANLSPQETHSKILLFVTQLRLKYVLAGEKNFFSLSKFFKRNADINVDASGL